MDALPQPQGVPALDPDACVACGACTAACPTDAVHQPQRPEQALLQTLEGLPAVPLLLVCPRAPVDRGTQAPVAGIVRHVRCLAGLDVADLLAATGHGQRVLWLDDTPCAQCPVGSLRAEIQATAQAADRLLQAFGHPGHLHTTALDTGHLLDSPESRPVIHGTRPRLSRRELFRRLVRGAGNPGKRDSAPDLPMLLPGGPVALRLPKQLPESRRRLLEALVRLARSAGIDMGAATPFTEGLPFSRVRIQEDRCSGCGLCARFCPTEALVFSGPDPTVRLQPTETGAFQLAFRADLCIDCGICQAACPEEAVEFGEDLSLRELVEPGWSVLAAGALVACRGCGAATAPRPGDGEPLCYACRGDGGGPLPGPGEMDMLDDLRSRLMEYLGRSQDDPGP